MNALGQVERFDGIVCHEPDRRRHDRIEQRGEMHADTANEGTSVLGEAARERWVDVLVGQVVRRQACDGREQASTETGHHDSGDPDPGRDGSHAREGPRCRDLGARGCNSEVSCHEIPIGKPLASLERGIPAPLLRESFAFAPAIGTPLRGKRARAKPAHSSLGSGGRSMSTAGTAALKRRHPRQFGLRLARLRLL